MRIKYKLPILLTLCFLAAIQVTGQKLNKPFPKWKPGYLDIHHINTGKGESAFFIFPDGTNLLVDAGLHERPMDANAAKALPDDSREPGEWIARYIRKVLKLAKQPEKIDYVVLTHFDTDHIGAILPGLKTSREGGYVLTGITEVIEHIPATKIIDRAWPDYNWPKPLTQDHILNYRKFVEWQVKNKKLDAEQFKVGSKQQIALLKNPSRYSNFEIRNIVSNGVVWTGEGESAKSHYPPLESMEGRLPSENGSSLGFKLTYGKFDYFTGGDLIGVIGSNAPAWADIETPVAKVTGPVDVNVMNHHGYRDAQNEFFLSTLKPRVHIIQAWDSWHPAPTTLERVLSSTVYEGPRDIFATNLIDTAKGRLGDSAKEIIDQHGHIVVRVAPGGDTYTIYVLDATNEAQIVKAIFGPYQSR